MSAELGASGEDVALWLETELFMDVQLETGEWLEGESIEVRETWLRIRFFARSDLAPIWLNVATDSHRLAELHTRSGDAHAAAVAAATLEDGAAEAARAASARLALDLFDEAVTRNAAELAPLAAAADDGREPGAWLTRQVRKRAGREHDESGRDSAAAASVSNASAAAAAAAASSGPTIIELDDSESEKEEEEDADALLRVSAVSLKLPLFDAHTHHRLVVPVRSPSCTHPEAFDLWTHVQHRLEVSGEQPIWLCPLCKKEAWASDLVVDPVILHALRLIEDGRLQQHSAALAVNTGAALSFTPASALMSSGALRTSLAWLGTCRAHPPVFGEASSHDFEERRLTLTVDEQLAVRITISTETDDASRREARRRAGRRVRGTSSIDDAAMQDEGESKDDVGDASAMRKRFKRDANDSTSPPAASSSAAAASIDTEMFTSPPTASPTSSTDSASPWPVWTDECGACWIDVRDGPDDVEGEDRWANIKVKIESAHAAYAAVHLAQEAQMRAPPPPANDECAAAATSVNPHQLMHFMTSLTPEQRREYMANNAPPSFARAATLPTPRSPSAKKKRARIQRTSSHIEATSSSTAAAAASSSSAAASASSEPLIPINTCSLDALVSIDGIGQKLAQRILDARYEKWIVRKVKWNDHLQAAKAKAAGQEPTTPLKPPCECQTPVECTHVVAFRKMKHVARIDGIGKKVLATLQSRVRL